MDTTNYKPCKVRGELHSETRLSLPEAQILDWASSHIEAWDVAIIDRGIRAKKVYCFSSISSAERFEKSLSVISVAVGVYCFHHLLRSRLEVIVLIRSKPDAVLAQHVAELTKVIDGEFLAESVEQSHTA